MGTHQAIGVCAVSRVSKWGGFLDFRRLGSALNSRHQLPRLGAVGVLRRLRLGPAGPGACRALGAEPGTLPPGAPGRGAAALDLGRGVGLRDAAGRPSGEPCSLLVFPVHSTPVFPLLFAGFPTKHRQPEKKGSLLLPGHWTIGLLYPAIHSHGIVGRPAHGKQMEVDGDDAK